MFGREYRVCVPADAGMRDSMEEPQRIGTLLCTVPLSLLVYIAILPLLFLFGSILRADF